MTQVLIHSIFECDNVEYSGMYIMDKDEFEASREKLQRYFDKNDELDVQLGDSSVYLSWDNHEEIEDSLYVTDLTSEQYATLIYLFEDQYLGPITYLDIINTVDEAEDEDDEDDEYEKEREAKVDRIAKRLSTDGYQSLHSFIEDLPDDILDEHDPTE